MSAPNDFSGSPSAGNGLLAKLTTVKLPLWVSLVLLILWAVSVGWQSLAQKRLESRLDADRAAMTAQAAQDREALLATLRERAKTAADASQREFGMALAWAVRGEMIRNNLDQVDQFFTEIVKLPGTERVVLVGADGKVAVSTDRRHLGTDAATWVSAEALQAGEVTLRAGENGVQDLVIPVMGLNARLGTVIVTRQPADAFAGL